jgi:hypothetical protein
MAAVPYAIIHLLSGPPASSLELTRDLYLCTVATCGISGAAIAPLLFLMLRRRGFGAAASAATSLLTGLATPLFAYSTMFFPHVPSALFILLALDLFERERFAACGAALGAAGLIFYLSVPVAIVFVIAALASGENRWRGAAWMVVGALPFAIALAAYQFAAFGSPLRTSIATENPAFRDSHAFLGVLPGFSGQALLGITFSPFRGLFYIAPLLLMALPGLLLMLRSRVQRVVAALIAAATILLFAINASFNGWHGGYTIGPRYILGVIPLLMLAAHYAAARLRLLYAVLAAIALVFNFAATAVDPQPPDILRDPLGRYEIPALLFGGAGPNDQAVPIWIRQLYTGHTSTNRVAADELMPFSRHAPGSPETEWASFNLGELLFGAGSAASLIPFFALMAVGIAVALKLAKRNA